MCRTWAGTSVIARRGNRTAGRSPRDGLLCGGCGLLSACWADPDSLDVQELPDSEGRELSPIAAVLHAAEGEARVGRRHTVDEDVPGLDAPCQRLPALRILSPQVAAESVRRVIGGGNCPVGVGHTDDGGDGTKRLLAEHRHLGRYAGDNGRGVEVTWPVEALATRFDSRSGIDRLSH